MLPAVRADESALTETHVGLERQRRHGARSVRSHAAAADVCESDEPVEIGDLRWVADTCHCQPVGGTQRIMVNENSERLKSVDAPRNRIRPDARGLFTVAMVIVGVDQLWAE